MKKLFKTISKAFILFGILAIIAGCSTSTNSSDNNTKDKDSGTTTSKTDTSKDTSDTDTNSKNNNNTDDSDTTNKKCSIVIPQTFNVEYNGHFSSSIDDITFTNCKSNDKIELVIEYNNGADLAEANYYDPVRECIFLYSYSTGIIGISLENKTAKVKSNICIVTFSDNSNNNGNNESNGSLLSSFYGTWYCSDAGLMKYLEFNSDGTGKAYASDSSNYSSFDYIINDNKLYLSGNVRATIQFSITQNTLTFYDCELFKDNPTLTYYKQ